MDIQQCFFFLEESLLDQGCVSSPAVPQKGRRTAECLEVGLAREAPRLPSEIACPKASFSWLLNFFGKQMVFI